MPTKLTPFVESLPQALQADARQAKHERPLHARARSIHSRRLWRRPTQLANFIRAWRATQGKLISAHAFVPLAFEHGEAIQFDGAKKAWWSVVGGIYYRLQVSHVKLRASRAFWLVAYPSQGHEKLFDAHTRSFTALGGVPRRDIYDKKKTSSTMLRGARAALSTRASR